MATIDQIIDRVADEQSAFRAEMLKLTAEQIYDSAHTIHIVEEIVYLICENPEKYEDDARVMLVLNRLVAGDGFLPAFLDWECSRDSIDVSNVEQAGYALRDFCRDWCEDLKTRLLASLRTRKRKRAA